MHCLHDSVPIILNELLINSTRYFYSTDDENSFKKNRDILGKDWYYYDKEIKYEYNSWGYRTKDFYDLKSNYIITFGCSFTEGIGLHYDDIWTTKIAKELNCDVFNLGVGGTGPDFSMYNTLLLLNFIHKNNRYPKYVIYQWSFKERSSFFFMDDEKLNIETFTSSHLEKYSTKNTKYYLDWYKYGFIENEGELVKQSNFSTLFCDNIWKSLGIPVVHWTWGEDFTLKEPNLFHNITDVHKINDLTESKARDLAHNGHLSQDIVVDYLRSKLL